MAFSKVGFITAGSSGNPNGIGNYVQQLNQANIPAVIACNDGIVGIWDILNLNSSVPHVMLFRVVRDGSEQYSVPDYSLPPKDAATKHWNLIKPFFNPEVVANRDKIWIQPINEVDKTRSDFLGYFGVELAKIAKAEGYKVMLFAFASGEPEPTDWNTPGMLTYLEYCAANPNQAGVALHEYDYGKVGMANVYPFHIGRFQELYNVCDARNIARPKVIISEFGWAYTSIPDQTQVMSDIAFAAELYAKFPTVLGATIWYLGGGFSGIANLVQPLIQPVTQYTLTTTFPDPEPTEPTPETRSFEIGWTTLTDRLQEPQNFKLTVIPPGDPLWYDSRTATGTVEAKHLKCLEQVPSNQCVGGDDPLILDGVYCFKMQAVNMASGTSLMTTFPEGGRVTVPINVHWQQDTPNETNDVFVTLLLNGVEVDRLQHPELKDRTWMELSGTAEGPVTAELRFQTSWPNSRDCFTDLWRLDMTCRGIPRVQYPRKYILLPPSVISADWAEAAVRGSMNQRITIGYSADDAGIGDLNVREVIAVNASHWGGDLQAFYEQYYPGITYTQIDVVTPAELEVKLRAIFDPPTKGFDNPVGTSGPVDGEVYPKNWVDVNPIGTQYLLNGVTTVHSGADLNLNVPVFDSDKFAPVYSIGSGTVTHAGLLGGTWGKVVVIKHDGSPTFYSRHAHLDNFTVSAGQTVTKGQQIGRIGNAEGQLPYHDHFDISPTNILQTNPGYWPGSNLNGIMQHFIEPRSLIRISRIGFINKTVYVKSSANFRSGPTTNFRIYKTLSTGTKLTALGEIDGYYLVRTALNEYGFVSVSLTQDNPIQVGNARLGIHAAADPGDISDAELDAFRVAKVSVIKVLSAHSGTSIAKLNQQHPNVPFIVRAFLDFGGRIITPTQFFNDTISDIQRSLSNISGEVWLEIANEPNLPSEGLGASWANGVEFNTWLLQTLQLYKNVLQGVKYVYPGLSPGFTAYRSFLNDSMGSALACDGVGVHTYWADTYSMNQALTDTVDYYVTKFGPKPLWITEASQNKAGPTPTQKGNQYIAFHQALKTRPSVQGVTYFVASASNPMFGWGPGGSAETWVGTTIPSVVGVR